MRLVVFLWIALSAGMAEAGPWPRDKAAGFLSFSAEYDQKNDAIFSALFFEYGITPKVTAGLDLGFADEELYKAVLFARYPISNALSEWHVAAELGLGEAQDETVLRPGLHFGRSYAIGQRSGWFTIESFAYYELEQNDVEVTTDITFGLNWTDRRKVILQLQNGNQPMNPDYLNLAGALVLQAKPGFHVEMGVKAGLKDTGNYALKLGIWRSF